MRSDVFARHGLPYDEHVYFKFAEGEIHFRTAVQVRCSRSGPEQVNVYVAGPSVTGAVTGAVELVWAGSV